MFLRIYSNARVSERVCRHFVSTCAIGVLSPGRQVNSNERASFVLGSSSPAAYQFTS